MAVLRAGFNLGMVASISGLRAHPRGLKPASLKALYAALEAGSAALPRLYKRSGGKGTALTHTPKPASLEALNAVLEAPLFRGCIISSGGEGTVVTRTLKPTRFVLLYAALNLLSSMTSLKRALPRLCTNSRWLSGFLAVYFSGNHRFASEISRVSKLRQSASFPRSTVIDAFGI